MRRGSKTFADATTFSRKWPATSSAGRSTLRRRVLEIAMPLRLEGTYTALVTPFRDAPDQPIDWEALDGIIDGQIAGRVAGLVPCGTTGESPTLSHEEHARVIER